MGELHLLVKNCCWSLWIKKIVDCCIFYHKIFTIVLLLCHDEMKMNDEVVATCDEAMKEAGVL